jgi:hypothetical protein
LIQAALLLAPCAACLAIAPTVTALRPASGGSAGVSTITLDGTDLDTVTSVTFDGSPATIIQATSTALTVTTPAHAAGAVDVVTTNPDGPALSTGAFTYVNDDDAARDFSIADNPAPRWSYGSELTRGATFSLYTLHSRSTVDIWSFGSLPALWHNPTNVTVQQVSNYTPPGKLGLHPGGGGEYSVLRWTSPASTGYHIEGAFVGLDSSFPTTTDVAVLHNNDGVTSLFSGNVASYDTPLPFSLDLRVSAGDTIEFVVGTGGNGYFGDATGVDATISLGDEIFANGFD